MTADGTFAAVVTEVLATVPTTGLARNGRGSLTRDGRVVAMTSRGAVVVRLDPARVERLVREGVGTPYKDQRNAWLQLDARLPADRVRALVHEAAGHRGPALDGNTHR